VPKDQVLRGHNFSPHGNANFIAKGSVKQHKEGMKDLDHKHEPPQLKEGSSTVSDLLGAFYIIRPRADRYHGIIEGTPQWGENVIPKGAQHDQHSTNQAGAKLKTVPGAQ